jgi:peptidyl-prolyl cis-trans isomerase SurA
LRWMIRVFLLLALLSAAVVPARAAEVVDRIVAVVNGQIITLFEINEKLRPMLEQFKGRELSDSDKEAVLKFKRGMLAKLIDDILLEAEAKKYNITVSDVEIENQVQDFRNQHKLSEEEFQKQLQLENMTRQDFATNMRKDIVKQRLIGLMVKRKVVVTNVEVARYYEDHRQEFSKDRTVRLGLIYFMPGQPAEEIRTRILAGEMTFAQAADTYSKGPGAGQGGDIGNVEWKSLGSEWREALDGVPVGGVSEPFLIQGRQALVQVREISKGELQDLPAVETEIRTRMYTERLEARFNEFMDQLRSNAVIDNRL